MEGDAKTIYLLDLIQNQKVCLRCINDTCKINEDHGTPFPEKERMSVFVKNPTYIKKFGKLIETSNVDFNGKKPFYTFCQFFQNCNNCNEGRYKCVNYENKQVILCYPVLDNIKTKVTVGVHIDIKLILKGTKYDVSFMPLEINNHLNYHNSSKNKINLNNINFKNNNRFVDDNRFIDDNRFVDDNRFIDDNIPVNDNYHNTDNNFPSLSPNVKIKEGFVKDYSKIKNIVKLEESLNIEKEEDSDNNFPSLSPNIKNNEESVKDSSKLKVILKMNNTKNKDTKDMIKIDNSKNINEESSDRLIYEKDNLISEMNRLIIEKDNLIIEKNNLIIQKENDSLKNELNLANNYIKELQNELLDLKFELKKKEDKLDREILKNKNKDVIDEYIMNIKEINTRVTEEYIKRELKDYEIGI